jgi:hypothetical protein
MTERNVSCAILTFVVDREIILTVLIVPDCALDTERYHSGCDL